MANRCYTYLYFMNKKLHDRQKNKENKETFTMIFVKILLVVIFVVVDIGLVVPETIQTKYSSTHFITHTHPPGGFLDFIQGGPKK